MNSNGTSSLIAIVNLINKPIGVVLLAVAMFGSSLAANYRIFAWRIEQQEKKVEKLEQQSVTNEQILDKLNSLHQQMVAQDELILQEVRRANDRIDKILQQRSK